MISIITEAFNPGVELAAFEKRAGDTGAIVSFVGKVRGTSGDAAVKLLHLEHYPGVTEKSVFAIELQARERWVLSEVLIIHRVGELAPGEPIVMVCTAAAHRREAFEAADFLMDYLKTEAMFWKKQQCTDGEAWIEPRRRDYNDAARWGSRGLGAGPKDSPRDGQGDK